MKDEGKSTPRSVLAGGGGVSPPRSMSDSCIPIRGGYTGSIDLSLFQKPVFSTRLRAVGPASLSGVTRKRVSTHTKGHLC